MPTLPACPCSSSDYRLLYADTYQRGLDAGREFSLYQCERCQLVRTFPVPGIDLYTEGYSHSTDAEQKYTSQEKAYIEPDSHAMLALAKRYQADLSLPVVDIGCNGGELVAALNRRGMCAEGIDVDPVAVAYGQNQGLNLWVQDICQQPLEKQYGFIVLNHTLEHIEDPNTFLRNVTDALVPGGLLHIRVPNYGGLIARQMGKNWGFLVPSLHVWQFTPSTLSRRVQEAAKLQLLELSSRNTLEYPTAGLKGIVKRLTMKAGELTNQSDEIQATFRKA